MKKNTIFILRAEILGFDAGNKKKLCFPPKFLIAHVVYPASQSVSTNSTVPRVHWQERVSDHLFPRSAEIVTVCSNTATKSN